MAYKSFDKNPALLADKSASGGAIKTEIMQNEQLVEELHRLISGKI